VATRSSTLDEYNRISEAVYEYVEGHYIGGRLDEFCAQVECTRRSVQRALEGGPSFRKLIVNRRISEAKELVKKGWLTVDVAEELGYSSPSALVNAFKKETGMTPTEYRRAQRNGR